MKKVILSAFGFILFAAVSANAQTQTTQGPAQAPTTQTAQDTTTAKETKTAIKVEELPEAVKTALTTEGLKEWTPTAATLVKDKAGKEYYAIEMSKGQEKGAIKLDKDGNQVK